MGFGQTHLQAGDSVNGEWVYWAQTEVQKTTGKLKIQITSRGQPSSDMPTEGQRQGKTRENQENQN